MLDILENKSLPTSYRKFKIFILGGPMIGEKVRNNTTTIHGIDRILLAIIFLTHNFSFGKKMTEQSHILAI